MVKTFSHAATFWMFRRRRITSARRESFASTAIPILGSNLTGTAFILSGGRGIGALHRPRLDVGEPAHPPSTERSAKDRV